MALLASTVIAGAGLALSAVGAYESYSGQKAAANANASASATQSQIAGLQAANVDTEQQQLQLQTQQQDLAIATNKSVIQQQQASDDIRQQAASLDATRRIRQQIRTGIVASGTSLNIAANSGAATPGSSAVHQVRANIEGDVNTNVTGISQQLQLGQELHQSNMAISNTYLNAQNENQAYVNQSEGLQSQVLNTQKQIYQLGGSASMDYSQAALAQGQAAIGSGMFSLGAGIMNNYSNINKLTSYFGGGGGSSPAVPNNPTQIGSLY